MKKIFTIMSAAVIFAACNSKSDLDTNKAVILTDTSAMYKSNASTDVSTPAVNEKQEIAPQVAPPKTIIRERTIYIDRTPKATRVPQATPSQPVVTVPQTQTNNTTGTPQQSSGSGTATTQTSGTEKSPGTQSGTIPTAKPVKKDEGWSNAAKDATIGGVGGAVVGAVISRKKGKGAVIGGIIGAAGGYILGRKKDKAEDNPDAKYTSY